MFNKGPKRGAVEGLIYDIIKLNKFMSERSQIPEEAKVTIIELPDAPVEAPQQPEEVPTDSTESLNVENKGFFAKLGERAKEVGNWAYETINKIPGVNKIVGKVEIAYHSYWMNRHEEKARAITGKISGTDAQIEAVEQSRAEIAYALHELGKEGADIPNMQSVQEKMKSMDDQLEGLNLEKTKLNEKLEKRNEKMQGYVEKRDAVVDRLVGQYQEKLSPLEIEIEKINDCKDEFELSEAVAELRHETQNERLNNIEKKKDVLEKALLASGLSEEQVYDDPSIQSLYKMIDEGREQIKKEQEILAVSRKYYESRLKETESKADVYRKKKAKFNNIKEGKPEPVEMPEAVDHESEPIIEPEDQEDGLEANVEEEPKYRLDTFVSEYNKFIKEEYKTDVDPQEEIVLVNFMKETGVKESQEMEFKRFKKILGTYYKKIKLPATSIKKFDSRAEAFYKEKINPEIK